MAEMLAPFGVGFEVEATMNIRAAKAGLTVWEVPSFERPRLSGRSNLNAVRDGLRILRVIWDESPGRALRRTRLALAATAVEIPAPRIAPDRTTVDGVHLAAAAPSLNGRTH